MIYDLDSERLGELTAAFAAGEQRGRQECDEHVMAECVALRVKLARYQAECYREGVEAGLMCAFAVVSVIGAWSLIAYLIWVA